MAAGNRAITFDTAMIPGRQNPTKWLATSYAYT